MRETRVYMQGLEIRGTKDVPVFYGRAAVYDEWSELLFGSFYERVAPGCFDKSLESSRDVICTYNHDVRCVLGRRSAGTLQVKSSKTDLAVECSMPDTSYARDLRALLERGDVRGMSFIFDDATDEWSQREGHSARTLKEATLFEVAFVTMPAYPSTSAGMRALGEPCAIPFDNTTLRMRMQMLDK